MTGILSDISDGSLTAKMTSWDDGKHAKVKKVQLTFDDVIRSIEVEYEGTNLNKSQRRGTVGTKSDGFTLSTDEYITNVSGYYKTTFSGDLITALTFRTNKKTYGPYGNKTQSYFSVDAPSDSQIVGFLGTSGIALSSIDVHFAPIPAPGSIKPPPGGSGSGPGGADGSGPGGSGSGGSGSGSSGSGPDVPGKKGPLGGDKGKEFNDVGFEGVKKVTVGADDYSITYIKIEYLKGGKVEIIEHGTARGKLDEFSVDYPSDSITEVGGAYRLVRAYDTTLITSFYFTTSKGFTSPFFGKKYEKEEKIEFKGENGGKLIGFHGRGDYAIDAIGAYFDTGSKPGGSDDSGSGSSTQKLDAQGGKGGNQWDDGGDHDGVAKIHVAFGLGIEQIKFEYVKNGQTKEGPAHGVKRPRSSSGTFEISHPDEYLLSVKGWADSSNKIVGIEFITNKKTSNYYGYDKDGGEGSTDVLLEVKDKKIVGFHGFADTQLNSLGAYFAPVTK